MASKDYIPKKDIELLPWARNLVDYVQIHEDDWLIDPAALRRLAAQNTAFDTALKKVQDPNHGSVDILVKNEARTALKKEIRQFVKEFLEYNHLVTDEDRKRMNLPIHDPHPSPRPKLHQRILINVTASNNGQHTVSTLNQATGKKTRPDEADGIRYVWGIRETPPADPAELLNSLFSRKTSQVFDYTEAQRGQRVFYATRYENIKGEAAPWSTIAELIIP